MAEVVAETAHSYNDTLLNEIVDKDILNAASVSIFDDAMGEIPMDDGTKGSTIIIGSTKLLRQQCNGIILLGNSIIASSDSEGVYSLRNTWADVSAAKDVDHIDLVRPNDLLSLSETIDRPGENEKRISTIEPIYIKRGNQYILHYELSYEDGFENIIDAKDIDRCW